MLRGSLSDAYDDFRSRRSVLGGRGMRGARSDGFRLLTVAIGTLVPMEILASEPEETIEQVVIVGSRIEKPDFAYSNPVITVEAQALRMRGTIDLIDYLKDVPALVGSRERSDVGGTPEIGATGLTLLNLRNLGTNRTLVLVDGRRHVAADPGTEAVDVDTIPNELIDRIEIMTGGASAIYGADGVSGVVNFVTKTDFDGFTLRMQGGRSGRGDADSSLLGFTAGKNFNEDRTNIALAAERTTNDRLKANDRTFVVGSKSFSFVWNPNDYLPPAYVDNPNLPDRIPLRDVRLNYSSRAGAVITDYDFSPTFDFSPDFNGDDTPWNRGLPLLGGVQQGGSGTPLDDFSGDLEPAEERNTVNLLLNHNVSARVHAFGELKYSKNESKARFQPAYDSLLYLAPDYAYTPPNIGAAAAGNFLLVIRDEFDMGLRGDRIDRDTVRGVFGIDGELPMACVTSFRMSTASRTSTITTTTIA